MRYRLITSSSAGLLLSMQLLYLAFESKLTLYVHPRYILFTVVLSATAAVLLFVSSAQNKANPERRKLPVNLYIVLSVTATALVIPPISLSTRTASIRNNTDVSATQNIELSSLDAFSTDFSRFSLQDWAALLSANSPLGELEGKEAQIEGFLLRDDSGQLYLARFKLSCCAVDATPLTVPLSGTTPEYEDRQRWYKVKGSFTTNSSSPTDYSLNVQSFEEIDEPEQPYVF